MHTRLEGHVAVVTGATGDIGAEYVRGYVREGAQVVATDLPDCEDLGRQLAAEATAQGPGTAAFASVDITSDHDLERLAAVLRRDRGRVDSVVNNAAVYSGLGPKRPLWELTNDDWDLVLRVNVRGVWQVITSLLPLMKEHEGASIINVASTVVRAGVPGFLHYVASKAAVEGLTRASARELGPLGVRVNAVAPGLVSDSATNAINPAGYAAHAGAGRSLAREMHPSDLVGTVLWLAGPESAFVTGQTLLVDGGQQFS